MKYCIFDIEADGLLDSITKIHCLSYQLIEKGEVIETSSILDYKEMAKLLSQDYMFVGHNIIRYDFPAMEKIIPGVVIPTNVIDTLGLSWYLLPKMKKHGLAIWGEKLGVEKPIVEDWQNGTIAEYLFRCESDVEINSRLLVKQMDYLMSLYDKDISQVYRLIGYVNFKMTCLRDQEELGITLDKELAEKTKVELEEILESKRAILAGVMPKVVAKEIPAKPYKKDGSLSAHGHKWLELILSLNLPLDTTQIFEEGNPGSSDQLKSWLDTLGWVPETFKVSKATQEDVPQVSLPFGQGICPSVKKLYEVEPNLIELENYYKLRHRLGIIDGYLKTVDDSGRVYASAHGFTNTMRLQHSTPIVNLPGVDKAYGEQIRGCLTVPDTSYTMCGSDISGLEDNTKQHYIYFYDPDYVNDMRVPGFDPHIDIAVLSGLLTKEEEVFFKWYNNQEEAFIFSQDEKGKIKVIKVVRGKAKTVNFSATYGAGPDKIASVLKCSIEFATKLHQTYWQRNWAVKKTAENCKVKKVGNSKWLFNPVSKFWMYLKDEKDRFSTLNQSTGVFVFDTWVRNVKQDLPEKAGICLQYHDELLLICKTEQKEELSKILKTSMESTNKQLKLNVDIGISIDWGNNYAECH